MTVPSGMTALSITTAPMPISTSLPTLAPCTTALCPTETLSPSTVSETSSVPCSTAPSWTLLPFPMRMAPTSPQHGPVPDAAVLPDCHVSYKCRIVSDKSICPNCRGLSVECLDYHNIEFSAAMLSKIVGLLKKDPKG